MPDDQSLPVLPPDVTPPWLARNRKLVILGGVAISLLIAAAVTYFLPQLWPTNQTANTSATVTTSNDGTNGALANPSARPTFQRSTVTNVSTSPPPAYQLPTKEQLQRAINQLNSTNASPP